MRLTHQTRIRRALCEARRHGFVAVEARAGRLDLSHGAGRPGLFFCPDAADWRRNGGRLTGWLAADACLTYRASDPRQVDDLLALLWSHDLQACAQPTGGAYGYLTVSP